MFFTNASTQSITAINVDGTTGWRVASVGKDKISLMKKIKVLGMTIKKKFTTISTDEFFNRLKREKLELKIIDSIMDDYLVSIERAKLLDQTALVEKLQDQLPIVKKETEMVLAGVTDYLTVNQVDNLLKKSDRNIRQTVLKNYTGIIPDDIVMRVSELKKKNIFDDFMVLHYDPKKENEDLTKAEKEKKKDPIIFGYVKNSDKYYYIADWIDEFCNLTMNEVVKIIGEKQKTIIKKKK